MIQCIVDDIKRIEPGASITLCLREIYQFGHSVEDVLMHIDRDEFNWDFDVAAWTITFERP